MELRFSTLMFGTFLACADTQYYGLKSCLYCPMLSYFGKRQDDLSQSLIVFSFHLRYWEVDNRWVAGHIPDHHLRIMFSCRRSDEEIFASIRAAEEREAESTKKLRALVEAVRQEMEARNKESTAREVTDENWAEIEREIAELKERLNLSIEYYI